MRFASKAAIALAPPALTLPAERSPRSRAIVSIIEEKVAWSKHNELAPAFILGALDHAVEFVGINAFESSRQVPSCSQCNSRMN